MSAASTATKPTNEKTADAAPSSGEKPAAAKLEEDDEFEDFPAEDWETENTDLPSGNAHLWEESWDDDETNDDFSAQLKEEMKKVEKK